MAYDEALAQRVREELAGEDGVSERKMFGGIAFMVNGNMAVGIVGDDLMIRTGRERYNEALSRPHARPMDFTGRPFASMVFIGPGGQADDCLGDWIDVGMFTAMALPPK